MFIQSNLKENSTADEFNKMKALIKRENRKELGENKNVG